LLDRVEVGRVGRQVAELGAARLDGLLDAVDLVAGEIVHDHDVVGLKGWGEHLFDIGAEDGAVHRPIDDQGRGDAVVAQAGDDGAGLPMAVGDGADQARPCACGRAGAPCWSRPRFRPAARGGEFQSSRTLADLFGLKGTAELAIIATLSYLGPRELEELLSRYIGRRPPITVGGRRGEIDSQEDRK
jgi:hypothetical protein